MECPKCDSSRVVKNGSIHNGKKKYACKECGRQFVENPTKKMITQDQWNIVDKLLLEKISLAGISRVTGISERWIQEYTNKTFRNVSRTVEVIPKKKGKLIIQCDEMWSFVSFKGNKIWIWLAIDQNTGEIVGVYIGSRDESGAKGLWNSLPSVYRQCAVTYTDFWQAYACIFPATRHRAVGKETGGTYKIADSAGFGGQLKILEISADSRAMRDDLSTFRP